MPAGGSALFTAVTAQLDPGGSAFVYLSAEQWLQGVSTNLAMLGKELGALAGPSGADAGVLDALFDTGAQLARAGGLEDLAAFGFSSAPVASNVFRCKMIFQHRPGRGRGFLWSLPGGAPHDFVGPKLLPPNTALALFSDCDLRSLWQGVEQVLMDSKSPAVRNALRKWPVAFKRRTHIAWSSFLDGWGGEVGLAVTLNPQKQVALPLGGQRVEIPEPQLLLVVKVRNDVLFDRLLEIMLALPQCTTNSGPGWRWASALAPGLGGSPMDLTLATSGDYLFLATSKSLIQKLEAIHHRQSPALRDQPGYRRWLAYLPRQGNGWFYADRAWSRMMRKLRLGTLEGSSMPPGLRRWLQHLLAAKEPREWLSVTRHATNGWQIVGVSDHNLDSVLIAPPVAVAALAAGVILPGIARASAAARSATTINRVKQLALAARLYAADHNDRLPPADRWCDALRAYVPSPEAFKAATDSASGRCSFAFNAGLSERRLSEASPSTVLFFETQAGWNRAGGWELLLAQPRSPRGFVFGFADGSVRVVPRTRVPELRWQP